MGPTYQLSIRTEHLNQINELEIKVSNLKASRIIGLDKTGVVYKKFYNINFAANKCENVGKDGLFTAKHWRKRHQKIWPELKKLLKEAGVSKYSILLDEETNTLFAFQEVSGEARSQDLGQIEIVKKWWAYMKDIMDTNPDNSSVSVPLQELFYLG